MDRVVYYVTFITNISSYTFNYTYNNNGNLTQQVSSLNGTTTYGYDYENRLVSAVTPSSEAYYGYSGDGRRTYSYIDSNEVEYIYDGLLPLIERNSPGTYIAAYTKLPSAPGGIGGLISSHDGANTLYYHDSNLGNLNQVTNSSGSVIQTYDYDAFGNITAQSGALTAKYAYKTKEYSPETGLIFFGRRYYNPLIGRFITKDPLGQVDGPNMYLYCLNDSINRMDLYGLYWGESAINWWLTEAVLPGPYGQPVSEWGPFGPTQWGDPMFYTDCAGGIWKWSERIAVGTAAVAAAVASGAMAYEAATNIRIEVHLPHARGPHNYPHLQGIKGPGWGKTIWRIP